MTCRAECMRLVLLTGFCLPIVIAEASGRHCGLWRSRARIGIDHLTKLTCDDPICRCTGERSHALSLASSVSCFFGWNERGVSAWGLVQCRDTDDTNRGSGDTRTIRWMVKMARSETLQMSIDWLRERRLLSEWRHETMPTEPPRSRRRNMAAALETDYGPQSPAAVLYSVNPGASKYVAAPASRGCCRCN